MDPSIYHVDLASVRLVLASMRWGCGLGRLVVWTGDTETIAVLIQLYPTLKRSRAVKKLPKTWLFLFKKLPKIFILSKKKFFEKMKIFGNFNWRKRQVSGGSDPEVWDLAPKCVSFAPNRTNPGLFQVRFHCIWRPAPNALKSDLKKSRICPIWGHSDPLLS